jgi:hypothetical protein
MQTIYRALYKVAPELAVKTFKEHEGFYHPIARRMIQKVGATPLDPAVSLPDAVRGSDLAGS